MTQLHKRFTDQQVKVLLGGCYQGLLARAEIQEMLGIAKSRFFAPLKEYRQGPEAFSVAYERHRSSIPQVPSAVGQQNLEDDQLEQGCGDGRELGKVELE